MWNIRDYVSLLLFLLYGDVLGYCLLIFYIYVDISIFLSIFSKGYLFFSFKKKTETKQAYQYSYYMAMYSITI